MIELFSIKWCEVNLRSNSNTWSLNTLHQVPSSPSIKFLLHGTVLSTSQPAIFLIIVRAPQWSYQRTARRAITVVILATEWQSRLQYNSGSQVTIEAIAKWPPALSLEYEYLATSTESTHSTATHSTVFDVHKHFPGCLARSNRVSVLSICWSLFQQSPRVRQWSSEIHTKYKYYGKIWRYVWMQLCSRGQGDNCAQDQPEGYCPVQLSRRAALQPVWNSFRNLNME